MTTKSKLFLVFGVLFFGTFVFIIGSTIFAFFVMPHFAGKRAVELNKKRSAETTGTITSYSVYRSSGDKYRGSSTSSTYGFKYEVNGVGYDNTQSSGRGEKTKGMQVKICYDPADPKSSEFYYLDENKVCGK